jgi:hypothetical protein
MGSSHPMTSPLPAASQGRFIGSSHLAAHRVGQDIPDEHRRQIPRFCTRRHLRACWTMKVVAVPKKLLPEMEGLEVDR